MKQDLLKLGIIVISSIFLVACGNASNDAWKNDGQKERDKLPEKERFIDASVEVACMVFASGDAFDPNVDWEAKTKAVFADHGFDVEDDVAMEAIAVKYVNDPDIEAALEAAMQECAGDLMEALEGLGEPDSNVKESEYKVPKPVTSIYSCSVSKNCGDMNSCDEAYYYLHTCGKGGLDRDNDGIPCETIC